MFNLTHGTRISKLKKIKNMTRIEKNRIVLKRKRMSIATISLIIIFFSSIITLCAVGKPSVIMGITLVSSILLGLIFTMIVGSYSNQLYNYRREIQRKREAILLQMSFGKKYIHPKVMVEGSVQTMIIF